MTTLRLATSNGGIETYALQAPSSFATEAAKPTSRIAFSAAHVVADPLRTSDPCGSPAIDWDATMAYRRYLWSLGLGVAEAMDTAQRGMGLDWPSSLELIQRGVAEAKSFGSDALIACGTGTDHLAPEDTSTIDEVIAAYELQCGAVEAAGGRIILMASRALAAVAGSADDYRTVYQTVLRQVREPVVLHWLGEMFDPALAGYWGSSQVNEAMDTCLSIITDSADKIDGIKISLLDKEQEISMRRRLPENVKMYTGDDFNYPELIAGVQHGFSHALLGIFDAIAPAASAALHALDREDHASFHKILAPTVPLSRHIFQSPTRFYKTGVVFMAWLNGHQDHFQMIGGTQSARSVGHFCELFRLADQAGLLRQPDLAASRMKTFLSINGIS
jgi:hypothetical protein